jgi:hypothetical protein
MITKIRLATPLQIGILIAAWLTVLLAIDYKKNPHLWAKLPPQPTSVPLALWVNHLCCSGCMADVHAALGTLPWIEPGAARPRAKTLHNLQDAEASWSAGDLGGWVDIPRMDLTRIDFVALERALREKGLVPSRMEFGGVAHFRLEAQVAHMCCGACEDAARRTVSLSRALSVGRLLWVDSVTTDRARHRVVVYARYLEPGKTVDVAELLAAFEQVGLVPFSLRVLTGPERAERQTSKELAQVSVPGQTPDSIHQLFAAPFGSRRTGGEPTGE